jgi:hypothetical protein
MPHKANATSFKPGPDPRRHAFTRAERRKGFRNAMKRTLATNFHTHAWLFRKIRGQYRRKRRESA